MNLTVVVTAQAILYTFFVYTASAHRESKMVRKIFKSGNSLVIALPKESIEQLGWHEGSELSVAVDTERGRMVIEPATLPLADIDQAFARQLNEFIEQYRPALTALAQ